MAQGQYLQVTFSFEGAPKVKELEPVFNRAIDWLRITQTVWIVWTTSTPSEWYARLKPHLGTNDRLYIFGIDNKIRHGWAEKWVWDWLDKKR